MTTWLSVPAFTVQRDATTAEAAEVMRSKDVGDVVVVDVEEKVVGIVTDRDLAVRVIACQRHPARTKVDQVMTHNPVAVDAMAPVEQAEWLMR